MRLGEYLDPGLVLLELETAGMPETVRALVARVHDLGLIQDPQAVEDAVITRERAHTTSMGGVAVPHATVPELTAPIVLVARASAGVAFGPSGLDPVRLFFLLLSPRSSSTQHIKLLARIARLVRQPGLVDRLLDADSADALLAVLGSADAQHV